MGELKKELVSLEEISQDIEKLTQNYCYLSEIGGVPKGFENTLTKTVGAQLGLESSAIIMKELLKEIWKAVVNAVTKFFKTVKEFFDRVLRNFDRYYKQLNELKRSFRSLDNVSVDSNFKVTLKSPNLVKTKNGLNIDDINTGLANAAHVSNQLNTEFGRKVMGHLTTIGNELGGVYAKTPEQLAHSRKEIIESEEDIVDSIRKLEKFELVGDLRIGFDGKVAHGKQSIMSMDLIPIGAVTKIKDGNIPTPSISDALAHIESIEKLVDSVRFSGRVVKDIRKARANAFDAAKKLVEGTADSKREKLENITVYTLLRMVQSDTLRPILKLDLHAYRVCEVLIDGLYKTLKQYQGN